MKFSRGYKYRLEEDYTRKISIKPEKNIITEWISLDIVGTLFLKDGYAWDGPSGEIRIPPFLPDWLPTVRLDITKDDKTSLEGSLVHDALYQLIRHNELDLTFRREADILLMEICIEKGMPEWKAKAWFRFVDKFAKKCAMPENRRKTYEI